MAKFSFEAELDSKWELEEYMDKFFGSKSEVKKECCSTAKEVVPKDAVTETPKAEAVVKRCAD